MTSGDGVLASLVVMKVAMFRSDSLLRVMNGVRKVAAGLRPFNESVWPGVRNDLFVAHQSIYHFASQYVVDRSLLDAGAAARATAHHILLTSARHRFSVSISIAGVFATQDESSSHRTFNFNTVISSDSRFLPIHSTSL
jgi:hypothetical protein